MGRLTANMDEAQAMLALGEESPGAIKVLSESLARNKEIDPDNALGEWGLIFNLDALQVYGERIWALHKEVCGESLPRTTAVARACQLGIISKQQLHQAIEKTQAIDVREIAARVREELPDFRA